MKKNKKPKEKKTNKKREKDKKSKKKNIEKIDNNKKIKRKIPLLFLIIIKISNFFIMLFKEIMTDLGPLPKPVLIPEKYDSWLDNMPVAQAAMWSSLLISCLINAVFLADKGLFEGKMFFDFVLLSLVFGVFLYLLHLLVLSFFQLFGKKWSSYVYNDQAYNFENGPVKGLSLMVRIGDLRYKKYSTESASIEKECEQSLEEPVSD